MVVNARYRLAPEHPFPAAMDDLTAALRWLVSSAGALGIDPELVAVGGSSAGGAWPPGSPNGPTMKACGWPSKCSSPHARRPNG